MASLGISEFTFGFAFLFEQTRRNWKGLVALPVLPSLKEEAKKGWDAELPTRATTFYYQFKLSEYLQRPNALQIRDGTYSGPYYRFWLHRHQRNRQHRLLRAHCRLFEHTYYVAPEVDDHDFFAAAFLASEVVNHSRLIKLQDCKDVTDNKHHCITFQASNPVWHFHSEAQASEQSFFGKHLETLYRSTEKDWLPLNDEFVAGLHNKVSSLAAELTGVDAMLFEPKQMATHLRAEGNDLTNKLLRSGDMLASVFGLRLVLVGQPRN